MSAKKSPGATSLSNTKISLSVLALILISVTRPLCAQQISARSLSLAEALEIARENNTSFLQSRNDESLSDWDVRQAYAALLPSASVGSGVSWQGPGEQQFGSLTLGDLGFGTNPHTTSPITILASTTQSIGERSGDRHRRKHRGVSHLHRLISPKQVSSQL